MRDLLCLLQLLTWLHVLDYHIFEIMKEESFSIHSLASCNCFTYRNRFQNGANDMSKIVNMVNDFFVRKIKILCSSYIPILFKFHQLVYHCKQFLLRNYKYHFRLLMQATALTGIWKRLNVIFSVKI